MDLDRESIFAAVFELPRDAVSDQEFDDLTSAEAMIIDQFTPDTYYVFVNRSDDSSFHVVRVRVEPHAEATYAAISAHDSMRDSLARIMTMIDCD